MESLHVLSEARGQGAGTRLMRATAAELLHRGHQAMQLGVVAGNEQAAHYYQRLGAALVKVEPVTWAQGVNHAVYRWPEIAVLIR
jgi:ribosomal protein S18 acetylase RimI-like enzyme